MEKKNRVKVEPRTMYTCRYNNLTQKQQKALKELKHKEDIVLTNANNGSHI